MKNYIKGGLKVLINYAIVLLIFGIFLYLFLSLAKTQENISRWLPVYSFVIFLLMGSFLYNDLRSLAVKEKKPQYNIPSYPYKGLILGLIGFSPLIFVEIIYLLVPLNGEFPLRVMHVALNSFMGPLYWFIKLAGSTFIAYAAASLIVPVISMLGYLAGFYDFELKKYFGKSSDSKRKSYTKSFTKSPWNPTNSKK